MHHKVKFDRWVGIIVTKYHNTFDSATDREEVKARVKTLIDDTEVKEIKKNQLDVFDRSVEVILAPKTPQQIGKIKSKKKRISKI